MNAYITDFFDVEASTLAKNGARSDNNLSGSKA